MENKSISNKIKICMNWQANILLVLLFCFLPLLVSKDGYSYIGIDKWDLYSRVIIPYLGAMLVGWALDITIGDDLSSLEIRKTDIFIIIYIIVVILSSALAENKAEVIEGFYTWYMGVKAQVSFVSIYFLISRYWKKNPIILIICGSVGCIVFAFEILERYFGDVLHLLNDLDPYILTSFVSTIGNIDWFACYMAIIVPFVCMFYVKTKNIVFRALCGIMIGISSISIVTLGASSPFLILFFTMFLCLCQSTRSYLHFERTLEVFLIIFFGFILTKILFLFFDDYVITYDGINQFVINTYFSCIAFIIIFIVYFVGKKKKELLKTMMYFNRRLLAKSLIMLIICYIVYSLLNTMHVLPSFLQTDISFFIWDHAWGSNRGVIMESCWNAFILMIKEHPLKLFIGAGADQVNNMLNQYYSVQLESVYDGYSITAAHNEVLNTLCNYGLIGCIGYIGMYISSLLINRKNAFDKALKCVIFVYFIHSLISFQQIISTPLLFVAVGMLNRKPEEVKIK